MKASDLKVGMMIRRDGHHDRTITAIGSSSYLFNYINYKGGTEESYAPLQTINFWEPVEPEPVEPETELYYRWLIRNGCWQSPSEYICETGHTTKGLNYVSTWGSLEKRIRTDIAPIDINGVEYPKGER